MQSLVYYFCYGSNLAIQRMRINNKSATKYANGLLDGYKLSFSGQAPLWKGAVANIVPDARQHVYGVVYTMSQEDITNLDKQEFGYDAIDVPIKLYESENQDVIICRTYVQNSHYCHSEYHAPSRLYKEIIVKGAIDNKLPEDYIENVIKAHPDNGIIDCGPKELIPLIVNTKN